MAKIKVIIKEVDKEAEIKEIEDGLESLQRIVKGNIEMIECPGNDGIDIIMNEEGKFLDQEPTLYLPEYNDIIVGNIIFAGVDYDEGTTISLTDEQCKKAMRYIKENQINNSCMHCAYKNGLKNGKIINEKMVMQ